MKRIAIFVLSRHITSLGGIGFYVDSFIKHASKYAICDLIVDRPVSKKDVKFPNIANCDIISSQDSVPYKSSFYFMYMKEATFMELGANILFSFLEASKRRVYDSVFVQSYELAAYVKHCQIDKIIPTFCYTHLGEFYLNNEEFMEQCGVLHLGTNKLNHITQIPNFVSDVIPSSKYSPLLTSDSEFIKAIRPAPEKNTVLYNATLRDSKHPEAFIEYCTRHKKKAKIITNSNGKTHFMKELGDRGIEYEIRTGIFGEDKIEFIASAEMMFHPSSEEMFSYAVLEGLCYMPVFVFDYKWSRNFPKGTLNFVDNLDFDLTDATSNGTAWARDYMDSEKHIVDLLSILTEPIGFQSSRSSTLDEVKKKIESDGGVSIEDYWTKIKERKNISFADLVTLYKIKNEVTVTHDETDSYLGSVNKKIYSLEMFT